MAFQMNYQDPADMIARNLRAGQEFGQNYRMNPMLLEQQRLVNAINGVKAQYAQPLTKAALEKAQLENKYYGRNIESEIGLRGAQAGHLGADTELLKLKKQYPGLGESGIVGQLAFANLMNDRPDMMKNFANMNQGPAQNQPIPNQPPQMQGIPQTNAQQPGAQQPFNPSQMILNNIQSEMNARNALANYRGSSMANMRFAPAVQKNMMAFQQQLSQEHPDWDANKVQEAMNAYLTGADEVNGEKLAPLSGQGEVLRNAIYKNNSTAQIQNQAATTDAVAQEFNNIDITPLKRFAGLKGKADVLKYSADMAAGNPVPQEFRDYLSFKDITSNFAMDSLRKGFGTSVVPGYVYATLGNASNPGSKWWNDPKQVENDWSKTIDWVNHNAAIYKTKAEMGATARPAQHKELTEKDVRNMSTEELLKIVQGG
jgi:hypothetical protein